jgi:hypothetical protein
MSSVIKEICFSVSTINKISTKNLFINLLFDFQMKILRYESFQRLEYFFELQKWKEKRRFSSFVQINIIFINRKQKNRLSNKLKSISLKWSFFNIYFISRKCKIVGNKNLYKFSFQKTFKRKNSLRSFKDWDERISWIVGYEK